MERAQFVAARELLARYLPQSRLIAAASLQKYPNQKVFLKLENELPTNSFKVLGALYGLHAALQRRTVTEVVASSTGNHGAAVAYAAKLLGLKARIFLPENCNPVKKQNIAALDAEIVEKGARDLAGAFQAASRYAAETGAYFLNDATDPDLPAGPGTIACEILEQQPDTDAIFVPMGDTALIRGVAQAAKQLSPVLRIIGVQAERAPSYFLSWQDGRAIETDTCDTIADGLATRTPIAANVAAIRHWVDDVVLVSEDEMLRAIASLLVEEHVISEPAGAAATAAFLKSDARELRNVTLLVTGANVTAEVLCDALRLYIAGAGVAGRMI